MAPTLTHPTSIYQALANCSVNKNYGTCMCFRIPTWLFPFTTSNAKTTHYLTLGKEIVPIVGDGDTDLTVVQAGFRYNKCGLYEASHGMPRPAVMPKRQGRAKCSGPVESPSASTSQMVLSAPESLGESWNRTYFWAPCSSDESCCGLSSWPPPPMIPSTSREFRIFAPGFRHLMAYALEATFLTLANDPESESEFPYPNNFHFDPDFVRAPASKKHDQENVAGQSKHGNEADNDAQHSQPRKRKSNVRKWRILSIPTATSILTTPDILKGTLHLTTPAGKKSKKVEVNVKVEELDVPIKMEEINAKSEESLWVDEELFQRVQEQLMLRNA
ncbi:hypothetical protein FB45DRAFT_1072671 [Roridomyces roridus]|uniref:GATA-type domain-containing protein n=1 Tax=Roridomyces roridus TaxID=1738132 RepID=A0AAD7AX30_9AGAR|nr:hypothetical protein FB45DRAFT_1072671 [Roridomyces roridus]